MDAKVSTPLWSTPQNFSIMSQEINRSVCDINNALLFSSNGAFSSPGLNRGSTHTHSLSPLIRICHQLSFLGTDDVHY